MPPAMSTAGSAVSPSRAASSSAVRVFGDLTLDDADSFSRGRRWARGLIGISRTWASIAS